MKLNDIEFIESILKKIFYFTCSFIYIILVNDKLIIIHLEDLEINKLKVDHI